MISVMCGVVAYLIGSISFAVVASKLFGLADPRTYGSKNPGATNVLRTGNKPAALLTLVGDGFKGWLAVFLAQYYATDLGLAYHDIAIVCIAVFVGHLWPIFHGFIGGKGVATALGVLVGVNPWLGLATLITWIVIAYAFRYSSLAALVSSIFAPFYYLVLFGVNTVLAAIIVMSALLVYRHRGNISNLIAGRETRIGGRRT